MKERTKKILLILLFIAITFLIAFILYYLFFRPFIAPPPPAPPIAVVPPTGLPAVPPAINIPALPAVPIVPPGIRPEIPTVPVVPTVPGPTISNTATGGITSFNTLVDTQTANPVLAANGRDLNYYDATTGFFYTITPDGQKKLFSDQPFKNVSNSVWSPNRQKVILEYPDGSKQLYDFNQKKSITLPSNWVDFVFSNDNKMIGFKNFRIDPENRYIAIANANGGNYQELQAIGDRQLDVHMTWSPNNKYIALYRDSLDSGRSEIYPIGFNNENYNKLIVEGRDFRFLWTPTGNKLVYSVFNSLSNYNPNLWVANTSPDALGTGRMSLDLSTWADKCAVASETIIYCAVPRTLEMGSGFRPDMADETPDDFYKIDLSTNRKELIAQPLFPTTVNQIFVSSDNKILYWQEKTSGQIKKLNL